MQIMYCMSKSHIIFQYMQNQNYLSILILLSVYDVGKLQLPALPPFLIHDAAADGEHRCRIIYRYTQMYTSDF